MHSRSFGIALAAVLLGTACAPSTGADTTPSGVPLAPTFDAAPKAERSPRPAADAGPGKHRRKAPAGAPTATRTPTPPTGQSPSPQAQSSPTAAAPAVAELADPAGDAQGLDAPAYVDLATASVRRTEAGYRVVVTVAAPFPAGHDDGRVTNVIAFVDTDLDGRVDHEVWATLADDGWSTSARHPDGAVFGPDSQVAARPSGGTLTLSFPGAVVGGAERFQWSVAAEHGTFEQVASGTTSRDHAPDAGGTAFPAS